MLSKVLPRLPLHRDIAEKNRHPVGPCLQRMDLECPLDAVSIVGNTLLLKRLAAGGHAPVGVGNGSVHQARKRLFDRQADQPRPVRSQQRPGLPVMAGEDEPAIRVQFVEVRAERGGVDHLAQPRLRERLVRARIRSSAIQARTVG